MNVNKIDHIVLTVKDIDITSEFYNRTKSVPTNARLERPVLCYKHVFGRSN